MMLPQPRRSASLRIVHAEPATARLGRVSGHPTNPASGGLMDRLTPDAILEARKRSAQAIRNRAQEGLSQPE